MVWLPVDMFTVIYCPKMTSYIKFYAQHQTSHVQTPNNRVMYTHETRSDPCPLSTARSIVALSHPQVHSVDWLSAPYLAPRQASQRAGTSRLPL
jgi:hypothetical protein